MLSYAQVSGAGAIPQQVQDPADYDIRGLPRTLSLASGGVRCAMPQRRLGLKTKASSVGVNLLMATLIIPLPLMPDNLQVTCNASGQLLSVLPLTTMHTLLPRPQAHVLARLKDRRRDSQMVGAGRSLVGACENSTHRFRIPSYPPTVSTPQRALTNESSAACP